MRARIPLMLLASLALTACNEKPDLNKDIVGQWESPTWNWKDKPFFLQFTADNQVHYMNELGWKQDGAWMLLDSGELQITYPGGKSKRCNITITEKTMVISPTNCVDGWAELGERTKTIKLEKQ